MDFNVHYDVHHLIPRSMSISVLLVGRINSRKQDREDDISKSEVVIIWYNRLRIYVPMKVRGRVLSNRHFAKIERFGA